MDGCPIIVWADGVFKGRVRKNSSSLILFPSCPYLVQTNRLPEVNNAFLLSADKVAMATAAQLFVPLVVECEGPWLHGVHRLKAGPGRRCEHGQ